MSIPWGERAADEGYDFEPDTCDTVGDEHENCPRCKTRMKYDGGQDGYWCRSCLVWWAHIHGSLITFDQVAAIMARE